MQHLYLRSGVHLAAVGDDLVSLDVAAGAYACLPGLGAVGARGPNGRLDLHGSDAGLFQEAGLVAAQPGESPSPVPPPPVSSCWRTERVITTPADRRRFAWAWLSATPRFWSASFAGLVEAARRGKPGGRSAVTAIRDAQAFDQLMPFAPFQSECLYRSFLLLRFLRLAGSDATWVFGVRTYPFQAHCWLQAGDTVLDDAVERICGYVPILAV